MRESSSIKRKFKPLGDKSLKNVLAHKIGKEFPRIGGVRIRELCAEMILEVCNKHIRPLESLQHGQVLWMGFSINDPPKQYRRTADTEMIPVVLDLSCTDDIEARLRRDTPKQRLTKKAVRLCLQAHKQGALLSNCDLAELLNLSDSYVAHLLCAYEKKDDNVIPRRATLHDMGSGLTHKRIICHKRYAQGKSPEQIARETYHALESVDRYLSQYDRVCHCRNQGMQPDQIAYTLKCSVALVREYIQIDEDLDANRCDDQNKTFKGRTR